MSRKNYREIALALRESRPVHATHDCKEDGCPRYAQWWLDCQNIAYHLRDMSPYNVQGNAKLFNRETFLMWCTE